MAPTPIRGEDDGTMRRSRIQAFDIAEDGTVELPDGAVVISIAFESEGPYGFQPRPVTAWVEVAADNPS